MPNPLTAAIRAANKTATDGVTQLHHGAAIWSAAGNGHGLRPTTNDQGKLAWDVIIDDKPTNLTKLVPEATANDLRSGAALAAAYAERDDFTPPVKAAGWVAVLKADRITTTDTRILARTFTRLATAGHWDALQAAPAQYVTARDTAMEAGENPKAARKAARDTVEAEHNVTTATGQGGRPVTIPADLTDVLVALATIAGAETNGDAMLKAIQRAVTPQTAPTLRNVCGITIEACDALTREATPVAGA